MKIAFVLIALFASPFVFSAELSTSGMVMHLSEGDLRKPAQGFEQTRFGYDGELSIQFWRKRKVGIYAAPGSESAAQAQESARPIADAICVKSGFLRAGGFELGNLGVERTFGDQNVGAYYFVVSDAVKGVFALQFVKLPTRKFNVHTRYTDFLADYAVPAYEFLSVDCMK